MLPYTGGKAQKRHACIAVNLQGGGGFEIWQYSERKPQPVDFQVQVGDLGIFAAKIKSRDVQAFHDELVAKYDRVGPVGTLPDGTRYECCPRCGAEIDEDEDTVHVIAKQKR